MPMLPSSDWNASLSRMSLAVDNTLAECDRTQLQWMTVLEPSGSARPPEQLLHGFEQRIQQIESRLQEATELAMTIERDLTERHQELNSWQTDFAQWQELLKREEVKRASLPG